MVWEPKEPSLTQYTDAQRKEITSALVTATRSLTSRGINCTDLDWCHVVHDVPNNGMVKFLPWMTFTTKYKPRVVSTSAPATTPFIKKPSPAPPSPPTKRPYDTEKHQLPSFKRKEAPPPPPPAPVFQPRRITPPPPPRQKQPSPGRNIVKTSSGELVDRYMPPRPIMRRRSPSPDRREFAKRRRSRSPPPRRYHRERTPPRYQQQRSRSRTPPRRESYSRSRSKSRTPPKSPPRECPKPRSPSPEKKKDPEPVVASDEPEKKKAEEDDFSDSYFDDVPYPEELRELLGFK